MKLCDCKEGQKVFIKDINLDDLTIKRLEIIGFTKGKTALVTKSSFGSILCVLNGKMLDSENL